MNYTESVDYLLSLQKFGIKLGLSSTENLLQRLRRPEQELPILHLAGTNGKGSVGATVVSILRQAGYKVGFYTSPHLVSFRERFVINGDMIGEDDVVDLTRRVKDACSPEEPPTFFEFVTAMAFLYFADQKVDLAVMETGMGGRLDATNVADPLVSVITNIAVEHTDYLGKTLRAIAFEKAGIIKPGRPVITGERRKLVRDFFTKVAKEKEAPLYILGRDFKTRRKHSDGFDYRGLKHKYTGLELKLLGRHQIGNAALALAAVELLSDQGFAVTEENIRRGLMNVEWPGRAEIIPGPPDLMLDGAHNPAAARTLADILATAPYKRVHLVLGIMADKDVAGIMKPLTAKAEALYLTRPVYNRAAEPSVLAKAAAGFTGDIHQYALLPEAIASAKQNASADDLIVVTGSLFTVGEARNYLMPASK